jgi:hypothetical protein
VGPAFFAADPGAFFFGCVASTFNGGSAAGEVACCATAMLMRQHNGGNERDAVPAQHTFL